MNINNYSGLGPSWDYTLTFKDMDNEARKKSTEEAEAETTNNHNASNDNLVNNPQSGSKTVLNRLNPSEDYRLTLKFIQEKNRKNNEEGEDIDNESKKKN